MNANEMLATLREEVERLTVADRELGYPEPGWKVQAQARVQTTLAVLERMVEELARVEQ